MATVCSLISDQSEISTHPISKVIIEGDDLMLTCNAVGNPIPSISWTKDGSVINANGDPRIIFTDQNKKLSIMNVTRVDDGQYRCVASNSLGNATSNASTLDVQCKNSRCIYRSYLKNLVVYFSVTSRMGEPSDYRRRRVIRRACGVPSYGNAERKEFRVQGHWAIHWYVNDIWG